MVSKQFHIEFESSVPEEDQRLALQKLLIAFDRQKIGASFGRVAWEVTYEEDEESIQGNITFDEASTEAEQVIARWKKRSGKPTMLSGKHTIGEGDHMVSHPAFSKAGAPRRPDRT